MEFMQFFVLFVICIIVVARACLLQPTNNKYPFIPLVTAKHNSNIKIV